MKFNIKKIINSAVAVMTAACVSGLNTLAAADNGFTSEQIYYHSQIKPVITADKICLDEYTSQYYYNYRPIKFNINISGADGEYASTGIHIYYDSRLTIHKDFEGNLKVEKGEAISDLLWDVHEDLSAEEYGMKGIFITTSGIENSGRDGTYVTINFTLPDYFQEGDYFPIDIIYKENYINSDKFLNFEQDEKGQLMQAYAFTYGIYNSEANCNFRPSEFDISRCPALGGIDRAYDGYIAIDAPVMYTTTTTTQPIFTTVPPVMYTTRQQTFTGTAPIIWYTTKATTTSSTTTATSTTFPIRTTTTTATSTRTPTVTTTTTTTTTKTTATAAASGFSIVPNKMNMAVGDTNKLFLIGASDQSNVFWTSENTAVAAVSDNGTVTAKGAGTAVIYAVYDGKIAECVVNVQRAATKYGDTNCDGELNIADATLVLQYLGNPDKYKLSSLGKANADVDGQAGLSGMDASVIQMVDAGIYKESDLPLKSK